jgi:predicted DNA-binding protein with PD1-like motif
MADHPSFRRNTAALAAVLCAVLAMLTSCRGTAAPAGGLSTKLFGGAQVQEVYRLRLDRGDLVLESLIEAIKERNIQDGAVLSAVGSVQDCTYHAVASLGPVAEDKYFTVHAPTELLSANGIIAAGEPHLHTALSTIEKGAFGGHLEKGCKVLYRVEMTIAKFSGVPLARKLNAEGTPLLQKK